MEKIPQKFSIYQKSVYGNYHYFFVNFSKKIEIFEKSQKIRKILIFLIEGDFDSFLLVLKIAHPDFLIFLAQIPSFFQVHMWLKPREYFGIFLGLN